MGPQLGTEPHLQLVCGDGVTVPFGTTRHAAQLSRLCRSLVGAQLVPDRVDRGLVDRVASLRAELDGLPMPAWLLEDDGTVVAAELVMVGAVIVAEIPDGVWLEVDVNRGFVFVDIEGDEFVFDGGSVAGPGTVTLRSSDQALSARDDGLLARYTGTSGPWTAVQGCPSAAFAAQLDALGELAERPDGTPVTVDVLT